jgi:hypothetical protein
MTQKRAPKIQVLRIASVLIAISLIVGIPVAVGEAPGVLQNVTIKEYVVPSYSFPNGITAGPDVALWFASYSRIAHNNKRNYY